MPEPNDGQEATIKMLIAPRLRAIRTRAGMSQGQFAERLGLSRKGYANYERGLRGLPLSARLAIMEAFTEDLAPSDVLGDALQPSMRIPPAGARGRPSDGSLSFWQAIREERRGFRLANYSKPARMLLALRDHLFVISVTYCAMKQVALELSFPFGMDVGGTDYAFVGSFSIMVLLLLPAMQDLPVARMASRLISCGVSARR